MPNMIKVSSKPQKFPKYSPKHAKYIEKFKKVEISVKQLK